MCLLGLVLVSALACSSAGSLYTDAVFDTSGVKEQYRQLSYASTIDVLETRFIATEGNNLFGPQDILVDELTPKEKLFLSRYYLEESYYISCETVIKAAVRIAEETGEMPKDGVALLGLNHAELLTTDGLASFLSLTPKEQLMKVRRGINPVSGHFYDSVSDSEWHPFGIYVERLEGEDGIKDIPMPKPEKSSDEYQIVFLPTQGWRFVIFGENPDTVLVDKKLWREIKATRSASSGSCGCKASS